MKRERGEKKKKKKDEDKGGKLSKEEHAPLIRYSRGF